MPFQSTEGAVGYDITANSFKYDEEHDLFIYGTGVHLEMPNDMYAEVHQRSSVAEKCLILSNCVGIVDSDYRGELILKFSPVSIDAEDLQYNVGDRIGQLIFKKKEIVDLIQVETLNETKRNTGGFGSTGK